MGRLHKAALRGDVDGIKHCFELGKDINQQNDIGVICFYTFSCLFSFLPAKRTD